MSYLKKNEEAVLLALELAYDLVGGPVAARDVQGAGLNFLLKSESQGGWAPKWSPFEFEDRTRKYLRRLARQGLVIEEAYAGGRRFRYAPTSEAPLDKAGALQKLLGTQEPEALVVGPLVDWTTAAKEFDRFLDSEMENLLNVRDLGEGEEGLRTLASLEYLGKLLRVEGLAKEVKGIEEREGVEAARQFIEETVFSRDEE